MSTTPTTATDDQSSKEVVTKEASAVASTAQDKAAELAGEATEQARDVLDQTRATVRRQAEEQGTRLASTAQTLAGEMKSMAEATDHGTLGGLVGEGADQIQRLVDRFERGGLDAVAADFRRLARRRPVAFLATSFAAGVAASRLLRHADTDDLRDAATSELDSSDDAGHRPTATRTLPPVQTTGARSLTDIQPEPAPAPGTSAVRAER